MYTAIAARILFPLNELLKRHTTVAVRRAQAHMWYCHELFRRVGLNPSGVRDLEVLHPRFFALPGEFKQLDGLFMAMGNNFTLKKLRCVCKFDFLQHTIYEYAGVNGWGSPLSMRVRELRRPGAGYVLPAGHTDKVARMES